MVAVLTALIVGVTVVVVTVLLRPDRTPPAPPPLPEPSPPPLGVLEERILHEVIVTLKSGTTFAGVLYAEDSGAVVICKAEHVARDGKRVPADGEVVVLRGDIDFIQRP
jgi:small nuclear ribonucleoprotein (snRNP)-like protein